MLPAVPKTRSTRRSPRPQVRSRLNSPPPSPRDLASNLVEGQAAAGHAIGSVQLQEPLTSQVRHEPATPIPLQEEGRPFAGNKRDLIGNVQREGTQGAPLDVDVQRRGGIPLQR